MTPEALAEAICRPAAEWPNWANMPDRGLARFWDPARTSRRRLVSQPGSPGEWVCSDRLDPGPARVSALRAGDLTSTIMWLYGRLRSPIPTEIATIAADPGTALDDPRLGNGRFWCLFGDRALLTMPWYPMWVALTPLPTLTACDVNTADIAARLGDALGSDDVPAIIAALSADCDTSLAELALLAAAI